MGQQTISVRTDLSNTGITLLGNKDSGQDSHDNANSPRTLVVLGVARGGTSAIAGALATMGVYMGRGVSAPVFEDLELAMAIEANKKEDALALIRQHDDEHAVWGYKRPSYCRFAVHYHPLLRNPRYLVIYRDPCAIANRAEISGNTDVLDTMRLALDDYQCIQAFLSDSNAPAMLISYEKLLQNPEHFIENIIDFCDLEVADTDRRKASEFIVPSPEDYVDLTRSNKSRGRLDIVERQHISGWAQYLAFRRTAQVIVSVNGHEITRVTADRFRQDLKDMALCEDGCCAFEVDLEEPLRDGDEIRVRVCEDFLDVMNSPYIYQQNSQDGNARNTSGLLGRILQRLGNNR